MRIPRDAVILHIFIGEDDTYRHLPLYEAIILMAREMQIAGATLLRGPVGCGRSARLRTTRILGLPRDLPIVIEIVDAEDRINAFLQALDPMMSSGLVSIGKVQVRQYGANRSSA
jgi:PII-like signaling protein